MDGANAGSRQQDVEAKVRDIKAHMPETYRAIQAKAAEIGRLAYALVRRGLAGEPNVFFAMERGWVVGTPFNAAGVDADLAMAMVCFGCQSAVLWCQPPATEATDGPH